MTLDVIAEHELLGVRREVDLVGDVGHVEPRHVVIDEGDGHDQRDQAMGKVLMRSPSSHFSPGESRCLKNPTMCWSTLTCLRGVAATASARMKPSS